ncbi:entericidin A/B family lipoprotein [Roseovarius amoyensis]|nr:entericidin A/B family lipoprotein [Roseovarius amoyensis]
MFRTTTILLSVIFAFVLSACETVEGAGRDIEHLGEDITEESQEAQ